MRALVDPPGAEEWTREILGTLHAGQGRTGKRGAARCPPSPARPGRGTPGTPWRAGSGRVRRGTGPFDSHLSDP